MQKAVHTTPDLTAGALILRRAVCLSGWKATIIWVLPFRSRDLNNDGVKDLVLGAYGNNVNGANTGKMYIFLNPFE